MNTNSKEHLPVLAVVLNWNGNKYLKITLESLVKQTVEPFHIIVIDNASTDGSQEICNHFPNTTLIQLEKNVGFAQGNNALLSYSFEAPFDWKTGWLFFSNNDVEYHPNTIHELRTVAEKMTDSLTVTPWIAFGDHREKLWYGGARVIPILGYSGHKYLSKIHKNLTIDEVEPTDYGTGCSLLVSASKFIEVKGFDIGYPHYCEDLDLCFRLKKKYGGNSYTIKKVLAFHYVSSSLKGNPVKYQWRTASLVRFFRREGGAIFPISIIGVLFWSILSAWIRIGWKGVVAALNGWWIGVKTGKLPIQWEYK